MIKTLAQAGVFVFIRPRAIILAGIVLGPECLARTAREPGKFVRNVKAYTTSLSSELKTELEILDDIEQVKKDLIK